MNSTFGVSLLYEAIELPPDSKVLFKGDWLTAWSQGQTQSPDDTDQINEVAWKLVDGQWKAVEYTDERTALSGRGLGDTSGGNGTEMQDFLDALSDLLFEHDLQDILGLRALPEKDFRWWVELPMGETAWRLMSEDGEVNVKHLPRALTVILTDYLAAARSMERRIRRVCMVL